MRSIHRSDARRTSDAEITRPQNDTPSEAPMLPSWHVHLELQPDELLTLHRLGFTGSALAWREGMPEWQPLRVGDQDPEEDPATDGNLPQPIPLTRRTSRAAGSATATVTALNVPRRDSTFSSKRHSTPPLAHPVPIAPRLERPMPEPLPPPPPPIELRPAKREREPRPLAEPQPHADSARLPLSAPREQKPASIPPPVAFEVRARAQRGPGSRALWLGAAALVALSASNGALVSALLWSLRHDASKAAGASSRTASDVKASASAAQGSAECPAPSTAASMLTAVAPLSVEQLPLQGATRHSSRPERSAGATASTPASTSSRRNGKVAQVEEPTSARRGSSSGAAPAGPLDRKAVASAVARAAGAASSCGGGPEKGRVSITFAPSGSVQAVKLVQSFGEPGINSCVLRAMGRARVAAFSGDAVTVYKTLSW
jgi:hypothetical protein